MSAKTDNHNLPAKLALRRDFLQRWHVARRSPMRVLDAFQGDGVLWSHLRREFKLDTYWGVDLKAKKGRLKIDSRRILEQPGWNANVIDLDAYGSPWAHWLALIANCRQSATVFLTIGMVRIMGRNDRSLCRIIGLNFPTLKLPNALGAGLNRLGLDHALARAEDRGFKVAEVAEAFPQKNARYIAIRLEIK